MSFFKKELSANTLATILMNFTLFGNTDEHDPGSFALGPRGISTSDGCKVLPNGEKRSNWEHLSSQDRLIIELETLFLRGFAISFFVYSYIKNRRVRERVISEYEQFCNLWFNEKGFDYHHFYSSSHTIYGGQIALKDISAGSHFPFDKTSIRELVNNTGMEFAVMCDPKKLIVEPLRSELAQRGVNIFTEASATIPKILEAILEKYKVTV